MNQYHFAASAMPTGYQFAQPLPVNQILFGASRDGSFPNDERLSANLFSQLIRANKSDKLT
jgi:hypothetical protein